MLLQSNTVLFRCVRIHNYQCPYLETGQLIWNRGRFRSNFHRFIEWEPNHCTAFVVYEFGYVNLLTVQDKLQLQHKKLHWQQLENSTITWNGGSNIYSHVRNNRGHIKSCKLLPLQLFMLQLDFVNMGEPCLQLIQIIHKEPFENKKLYRVSQKKCSLFYL